MRKNTYCLTCSGLLEPEHLRPVWLKQYCDMQCYNKQHCSWCEAKLSKNNKHGSLCSSNCTIDANKNNYPTWIKGRIGPPTAPLRYTKGGYHLFPAPNKYRNMIRSKDYEKQVLIDNQRTDFPDMPNACGWDIDPDTWDVVLIWKDAS